MTELILLLSLALTFFSLVLYRLSKPLSKDEILKLAQKRRQKKIRHYFSSSHFNCRPPDFFKKNLKSNGKLYEICVDMHNVQSFVSNLLKYKKHEWSVITFIENGKMQFLWANKGPDRTQVNLASINFIVETAKKNNCDVIMAFHNHPAHDPNHYSYHNPSDIDLQASQKFSEILNSINISYLDHVCERGTAHRFCLKPSETLHPLREISNRTETENSQGKMKHIKLHLELMFT